ncbi:MAG: hypothetical protein IJ333_06225 [Clostridia bacterium]|nr:hypothetical protein [Clostridia bacterium]
MLKSKRTIPFWILAVIGLVCSLMMLGSRLVSEHADRQVSAAICYNDVLLLAEESNSAPTEWLAHLKDAGVYYLVVTDANEAEGKALAETLGLQIARSGNTAKTGDAFLMPDIEDYELKPYEEPLGDASVPLVLAENPWRTGVMMPEDFDPDQWEGPMVKTLYMIDGYRYHYEMQEPSTENENILFRAVVERGMRLLILTPLIHEGDEVIIADPAAYTDMLAGLSRRIADRGLVLGETFSAMDAPQMNGYLLGGALLLLVAMVVLLLRLLIPITAKIEWLLLGGGTVFALGGAVLFPALMQKVGAFGAALIFPCLGAMLLVKIAKGEDFFPQYRHLAFRFLITLSMVLLIGLAGGLYISGLLATRQYMMQFSVFTGVKLSQLLPMGFAGLILLYTLFNKKARAQTQNHQKLPLPLLIVMLVGIAAVLVVLILRSGDNMMPIADLEVEFRNWLEYVLYARPRTKEMLLAFPAIGLFLVASRRRYPLLQLPLGVLASIGAVSIVNTFCHIFTPVRVSLIRTLLSGGIGLVIGIIGMVLFSLLLSKKEQS